MPTCKLCNAPFPTWMVIEGKKRNLQGRSYCLACSPFKSHNTRKLEQERIVKADKNEKYRKWQKKARAARKRGLVELLGGRCSVCGYNKDCPGAFAFHHADPTTKKFNISGHGFLREWQEVVQESRKCVLLCATCHAEVHAGMHADKETFWRGQVAQPVEHSPEKAGVVGSNPTLSTEASAGRRFSSVLVHSGE